MKKNLKKSRDTRILVVLVSLVLLSSYLIGRLFYLQVIKGEELKRGALEQWTRTIDMRPERGIIYDRTGKVLGMSINGYTLWVSPELVNNREEVARELAEIIEEDEAAILEKLNSSRSMEKIKQWITKEQADLIREKGFRGLSIVSDSKRFYPNGNFAPYVLGFTNIDNIGLEGLEKTYNNILTGTPGRWIRMTDAAGRQLPYGGEMIYEPINGSSIVLTLDETIQSFTEKVVEGALEEYGAQNISVIIMDPRNGDILSMVNKPDFDPNNPRVPLDDEKKQERANLDSEELQKQWYNMWRNPMTSDIFEPGSTFKLITAAIGIEENLANPDTMYHCSGFIRDVPGGVLRCIRWYDPHGPQSLRDGMNNSCNVVFVDLARKIGRDSFYKYVRFFGFGERTNIELLGEQFGIIPANLESIREINLATMSYGHGIAVTPIQLITAVSSMANGGNLMEPRLVSHVIDSKGNVLDIIEPRIRRKVLSQDTSNTMLSLMESVVEDGSGGRARVEGYRIGGKTGTAQKIVDGRYAQGKYISSFVGVAPIDDPRLVVLVVVDDASKASNYGGVLAAPIAGEIFNMALPYLEISPRESIENRDVEFVEVPNLRNKTIEEAGEILVALGLRYNMEYIEINRDSRVVDQFPSPGETIEVGAIIELYLRDNLELEFLKMPYIQGKKIEEAIEILEEMNLRYTISGSGSVVEQEPLPGEEVDVLTNIKIIGETSTE